MYPNSNRHVTNSNQSGADDAEEEMTDSKAAGTYGQWMVTDTFRLIYMRYYQFYYDVYAFVCMCVRIIVMFHVGLFIYICGVGRYVSTMMKLL